MFPNSQSPVLRLVRSARAIECARLYKLSDAGKLLGMTGKALRKAIHDGSIRATRVGPFGWWRLRADEIARVQQGDAL
jgi:hypothetical protein